MMNTRLAVALAFALAPLATACAMDEVEAPIEAEEPAAPTEIRSRTPVDLDRAVGTWSERYVGGSVCAEGCDLVHRIERDAVGVVDAISVRGRTGEELCTLTRKYRQSAEAGFVDYLFAGDTCGFGPQGIGFEAFAAWTFEGDRVRVSEWVDPATGEGAAPATWVKVHAVALEGPASTTRPIAASYDGICELLPAEGACASLCDHDALVTSVPEGTCASFVCELSDGRRVTAGACNR